MKNQILLTVEELAKYLKIKPDTIYKKVRRGELPAIKLGKLVRFPKELIDQWIVEQANRTVAEVRKTANAARSVISEVPQIFDEIRHAPLDKKTETIERGLKDLWKDFNTALAKNPKARAPKRKTTSKTRKAGSKGGAHKTGAAPETSSEHSV